MTDSIHIYGQYMKSLMNKEINWATDKFALMLCGSGYSPDQDTHQYKSSVTNEVTGTGYTAGGIELTNVTMSYDSTNNWYTVSADPFSWSDASFSAKTAVLYDKTPSTDATRPLVLYVSLDPVREPENGTLSFAWNASGIFRFRIVEN